MKLADDDGNIICDIAKTKLEEGDVLVLDFKESRPDASSLHNMSDGLRQIFPNNKVMFLCNGIELKIVNGGRDNEQRN